MSEENKALVRRMYDVVFNERNIGLLGEVFASNIVDHTARPGTPPGVEGLKQQMEMFLTAFPDLKITAEDIVAEGDRVAVRWTATGTHRGDLMGIQATGKQVTISGMEILRIVDGKAVEHWEVFDQMSMMQQLGVVEQPG